MINLNLEETELRLGLPGGSAVGKRDFSKTESGVDLKLNLSSSPAPSTPSRAKAQVVGWPPVRSFRKNMVNKKKEEVAAALVKVSVDGAPYLRKVDLKTYKSYKELSEALANMFTTNDHDPDYVPTYQDKDGDWMLVGDVPWEMFVESCKRLRIMKASEAIGLAPRAVDKCNN